MNIFFFMTKWSKPILADEQGHYQWAGAGAVTQMSFTSLVRGGDANEKNYSRRLIKQNKFYKPID